MKKLLFLFVAGLLYASSFAQVNQNFWFAQLLQMTGKPIIKDTLLLVTGGGDTLYLKSDGSGGHIWVNSGDATHPAIEIIDNPITHNRTIWLSSSFGNNYNVYGNNIVGFDHTGSHENGLISTNVITNEASGISSIWDTLNNGFSWNLFYDGIAGHKTNQMWGDSNGVRLVFEKDNTQSPRRFLVNYTGDTDSFEVFSVTEQGKLDLRTPKGLAFSVDTFGGAHFKQIDSVSLYALSGSALSNFPQYYCTDCTPSGGGSGGVKVCYNGSAWKREW